MDTESYSSGWLMLLTQLPSKPSSARVALWRRLRAAGATALVNGAWALPCSASYAEFFEQSRESIIGQGGIGWVLRVEASSQETNEAIMRLFQADRAREYDEFAERCSAFLNEINRESDAGKYTFAEMEESEQDLEKLARWLAKIEARDFFPDGRRQQSADLLARCRTTLEGFSQAVYTAEGVQDPEEDVAPGIAETVTERTAAAEPGDPDCDAMITDGTATSPSPRPAAP
jgi:hypothetical protein